jgi:hypothetical protein
MSFSTSPLFNNSNNQKPRPVHICTIQRRNNVLKQNPNQNHVISSMHAINDICSFESNNQIRNSICTSKAASPDHIANLIK